MSSPLITSNDILASRLSQESKDFMSTLPKEKTFTKKPVYLYEGFWYLDTYLEGAISSQKNFDAQDSDVFLVTFPKCGTTWLKAIMFALLNRKRLPVVAENHPLLTCNPHDLVPYLEMGLYGDNKTLDIASFPSPRLLASHMPYSSLPKSISINKGTTITISKLVYLARNPKDTFVSSWHFAAKLGFLGSTITIEEAFDYFCKGLSLYGPFWDHVLEYWKLSLENPERVLFLKYEDMKAQPRVHLRRLAEFLDCPFSSDEEESGLVHQILELCSFDNLTSLEVNKSGKLQASGVENGAFFRRGKVGDWKTYISDEMARRVDQITQEKFSPFGLFL